MQYRKGQKIAFTQTVHRSSGSAYRYDKGTIAEVTGDGYRIRLDNGAHLDLVKDNEIEEE